VPEGREREMRKEKVNYRGTQSVVSPSFSGHGGTRLDPFQGYVGSPAKPYKTRVHDDVRACGLPCAGGLPGGGVVTMGTARVTTLQP
jgi:hypothetical protein